MKKFLFNVLLLLVAFCVYPQKYSVEELIEYNPYFPDEKYTFPVLKGPNEKVVNKINSFLVRNQLQINLGEEKNSIFENIWQKPDDPVARIAYLTYKVNFLNDKIYTVTISGEFCNAYCEGYDMTYTFGLQTASLLTLDTLFNSSGKKKLLSELIEFKSNILSKQVVELEKLIQTDTIESEDRELYSEMLNLYKSCNSDYADLQHFRFLPSSDSIEIVYGRCSAHYNRSFDELWYFRKVILINEWDKELSDLGRRLLK